MFMDCSNFMTHLSDALEDEFSDDSPVFRFTSSSGRVLGWKDSSTATLSSLSFRTVARTLHDFLKKAKTTIKVTRGKKKKKILQQYSC